MKPLKKRSVTALIRKHKKLNSELIELLANASSIITELENRGWHHDYNYEKQRYEWQQQKQKPYDE
jgi:hypothetical protein